MTDGAHSPHRAPYREREMTARDGLRLYFRDYGDRGAKATPVLCLPGLTRNCKDFADLAARLSEDRRVICPDLRGRGRSQYDRDWRNYAPRTYVEDIRHLLIACGVHRVHVIGTSLGGILAMAMAVAIPGAVAGAVLNDIGPDIDPGGLGGIIAYMKDTRTLPDWTAAARHIQDAFPDLPARAPGDWLSFARNTYRETSAGGLVHDWDDAIVKPLEREKGGKVNMWPLFGALGRVPVLAVHGAKSNILSDDTFRRMADAMPAMTRVTVDDCGHPPSLGEAHVLEAIDAHLARA